MELRKFEEFIKKKNEIKRHLFLHKNELFLRINTEIKIIIINKLWTILMKIQLK